MAFYLGSFTSGLFSGAQSVATLYGMYQGISNYGDVMSGQADVAAADQANAEVPGWVKGNAAGKPQPQYMGGTVTGGPTEQPPPPPATKPETKPAPAVTTQVAGGAYRPLAPPQAQEPPPEYLPPAQTAEKTATTPAPAPAPTPETPVKPEMANETFKRWFTHLTQPTGVDPMTGNPTQTAPPSQVAQPAPAPATAPTPATPNAPQFTQRPPYPSPYEPVPAQGTPALPAAPGTAAAAPSGPAITQPQPPPPAPTPQTPAQAQTGMSALINPQYPPAPPQPAPAPAPAPAPPPGPQPTPAAQEQTGITPMLRSLGIGGGAPAPTPGQPEAQAQPPSAMQRVLSAINPISSAQASTVAQAKPSPSTPAPASANPPPQKTEAGPVVVEASAGKPPAVQSQNTPPVSRPMFKTEPFERLVRERPSDAQLLIGIATKWGVSPQRLALHWDLENGLKEGWQVGTSGELGMMQILPDTLNNIDPRGQYDPRTKEGALNLAALYIAGTDAKFGKDSPSSVMAYQQGAGNVNRMTQAANHEQWRTENPNGAAYWDKAYPGVKGQPAFFNGSRELTPEEAKQFVLTADGGPDQVLQFVANTAPANMGMSDAWRRIERGMMGMAALRGDMQGVMQAQQFVLQMSHQGALSNLAAGHAALAAGDVTTAANLLAKAHAFFPDNSYGRFGIGKDGKLYGEQFDEHTGKKIGRTQQITPETVMYQMMALGNPQDYVKTVQEQQKINETSRYHREVIAKELLGIGERSKTADLDREQRERGSQRTQDTALGVEAAREASRQQGQQQELTAIVADGRERYTKSTDATQPIEPAVAAEEQIYHSLRNNGVRSGKPLTDQRAAMTAKELLTGNKSGKLQMRDAGNGKTEVLENGHSLGLIDTGIAIQHGLAGAKPIASNQGGPGSGGPVGQLASQMAMMQSAQTQKPRGVFA